MRAPTLFLTLLLLTATASRGRAQTLELSTLGFSDDNTAIFLQALNDPDVDTIIVDRQATDWNTGPLKTFAVSDKTILFEPGVVVRAIPGAFNDPQARLFDFRGAVNLTLRGYGATIAMNKAEYAALADSEFRHAVSLFNCENVRIEGLTLRDSGGDGIYVGGENGGGGLGKCRDVTVTGVRCLNNYRQGMSIASVENMLVTHSEFRDTGGALPEAGVDIEPYLTYQEVTGVRFENCSFTGNGWAGIAVALVFMDGTSPPVSIDFTDCYLSGNRRPGNPYAFAEIVLTADPDSPVTGQVTFTRTMIDGSDWSAVYTSSPGNAFRTDFIDCFFKDVSREDIQFNEPIFLETPSYDRQHPSVGNLHFTNLVLTYPRPFAAFRVFSGGTVDVVADVSGNITAITAADYGTDLDGLPTTNYSLAVAYRNTYPATSVSHALTPATIAECTGPEATLTLSRAAADESLPLLVRLAQSGTADNGRDYTYLPPARVIPAGAGNATVSLAPVRDGVVEPNETIAYGILGSDCYTVATPEPVVTELTDCGTTLNSDPGLSFRVRLADERDAVITWLPQPAGSVKDYRLEYARGDGEFAELARIAGDARVPVYRHRELPVGLHYYRLRLEAPDGEARYSRIVAVERRARVRLFPNPTNDWLGVSSELPYARLVVFGADGRIVRELRDGGDRVGVGDLAAGTYWLRAYDRVGETLFVESFLVR